MFVTIFDLLAGFIIYMKIANRCAAVGFLRWLLGVFGSFMSANSGNASSSLLTCNFPLQLSM